MKFNLISSAALISAILLILGCSEDDELQWGDRDFKQDMRDFVIGISEYSASMNSTFLVIPQNGQELLTVDGSKYADPAVDYIDAIDGVGREELFYGYNLDNVPTPDYETEYMAAFLDIAEANGVEALVTDYCWFHSYMMDSYLKNAERGYVSFAADSRQLDNIPDYPDQPFNENEDNITELLEAKNFLYLINPENYSDKTSFISALQATNYDILIIDLFFDDTALWADEVLSLKTKANGGARLVIAYMSIGEAENYRYYWEDNWGIGNPDWIVAMNPYWEGNYVVEYWREEWQDIIYGNDDSYLFKIMEAGFDGVYLDIIDAFEYFEENN
jgi:cysteinyl-tRNA synthetase